MGVLTYTAKRNVIGAHTAGVSYQIETAFQRIDEETGPVGSEQRMIDVVTVEYELDGLLDTINLLSDVVTESELPTWKEFLTSVMAREIFQLDLTGTIASPGTDLNCILYKNTRWAPRRTQDGVQTYRIPFNVQVLS
jgi:hypothetical protein